MKFYLLFLFVTEKDGKTCLNVEKGDFDLQTVCEAPVRRSKFTTDALGGNLEEHHSYKTFAFVEKPIIDHTYFIF